MTISERLVVAFEVGLRGSGRVGGDRRGLTSRDASGPIEDILLGPHEGCSHLRILTHLNKE